MSDERRVVSIPTYRYTLLPSGMVGANCMTCEWCGALVLDETLHTRWHNPFYRAEAEQEYGSSRTPEADHER
jgi:hypothetical protein